jgi:NAD-dependent deacetylase
VVHTAVPPEVVDAVRGARRVAVVSGAGMSADSGVPTFRDAQTGLWAQYDAEDLATPDAWERDPAFVWAWYLWRFERVRAVEPNAGHRAVARWSRADGVESVTVVTQNVDDLHERAGSVDVVHLHGSLSSYRCSVCEAPHADPVDVPAQETERIEPPNCAACGGLVRPGVVWFGELLPRNAWERGVAAVEEADLVVVVGTSGLVHPAAGLPVIARGTGAVVVEVNPHETDVSDVAHHRVRSTAAVALPALVAVATSA